MIGNIIGGFCTRLIIVYDISYLNLSRIILLGSVLMNDRFGHSIVINMSSSSAAKLHNSVNNSDRFPERAPLIGYLVFISYTRCCDFDVNCPSQSK